jgi:hypothetical protein
MDRTGIHFRELLEQFSREINFSVANMSFAWKTYFICKNNSEDGAKTEVVQVNPLILNVQNIVDVLDDFSGRIYMLNFTSCYNTTANISKYSKMFQHTITHSEGNLHNEVPRPIAPTGGILPRGAEDGIKSGPRDEKLNKSKPMKNFKEVFEALIKDLNEQKFVHKKQLQKWLAQVNQTYTEKINVPSREPLPIKYILEQKNYQDYVVDNRNLPFEQPEQQQDRIGIRTIPAIESESLMDLCSRLLMYSSQVSLDYIKSIPEIPRFNLSYIVKNDEILNFYLKVKKVIGTKNLNAGLNTGPGNNLLKNEPLSYSYQESRKTSTDIIDIQIVTNPLQRLSALEQQIDTPEAKVVYGDREQTTGEKTKSKEEFFKQSYNGVRAIREHSSIFGRESGEAASNQSNYFTKQTSLYLIHIWGNPNLLNDINIHPMDAATDSKRWDYEIYEKMDSEPSYVKLTIKVDPAHRMGEEAAPLLSTEFDNFLHLFKVKNVFDSGRFEQYLSLLKSDESM